MALLNLNKSIILSVFKQSNNTSLLTGFQSQSNSFPYLCRWVKFEEKVEEGGERWSKPHVSTLTLHSLFELRTCLQTGSILLDLEGYSLPQIVGESLTLSPLLTTT